MHQRKSSFRWISVMLMSVIVLNAVLFGAAGPVKAAPPGGLSAYNAAVTAAEMYQAILDYPNDIFETVQQKDSFYWNRKADNDAIVDDLIGKRPFATVTDLRDAYGSALDNRNFFLFLHEATDNSGVSAALSWVNDGTFLNPGLDLSKYFALDYTEQAVVDQAILDGIPVDGYAAASEIQTIIDTTIGQIVSGALQDDKTALEIGYAVGDSDAHVTQNLYLPDAGTHFTQITWTGGNGVIDPATGIVTPPAGGDVTAALQAKISRNNESVTKDFTLTVKSSAPPATPPAITAHPQSVPPILPGMPASFSVTATGTGLTYQWQVNTGSGFVNLPGDTNATLSIPAVSPSMNGYMYRVIVSGTGGQPVTSNGAVLNVMPPIPTFPPAITAQPQHVLPPVLEGNPASFSVTATGTGLTYQWQVNTGSGFLNLQGETNATLSIPAVSMGMNGYMYRVVVSGTGGQPVTSNGAVLNVMPPIPTFPPAITAQPQNTPPLLQGMPASFSVTATGTSLTYQWQVNTGSGFLNLPGETNATLSILAVSPSMNGYMYRVIVSGTGGQPVTSNGAALNVMPPFPTFPPVITLHPQSPPPVLEGNPASFSVMATGMGLTYQWQEDSGIGFLNLQGETNATLSIPAVSLGMNNYKYRVVVSGTGGQPVTSNSAVLTVLPMIPTLPPAITAQPQNTPPLLQGMPASFSVTATGTSLTYQWQVNTGSGFQNLPGETNATLSIPAVSPSMNGYMYRVIVSGTGGQPVTSNGAVLNVMSPIPTFPPVITLHPQSPLPVVEGNPASFSVMAAGMGLTYQWQEDSGSGFLNLLGETNATLTIPAVSMGMNGYTYRVVVSGMGGQQVTSNGAVLNVLPPIPTFPPAITAHPQNVPPVLEGAPASFTVIATGTGLTYQWQLDTGSGFQDLQGETNATLNIPVVSQGMNGYKYRVVVSGTVGQPVTSTEAVLTVYTVPSEPTNVTATAGDGQAVVSFTAPVSDGGTAITGYEVTASPGDKVVSGTASPITVTGLANGTAYTFTVKALNAAGGSAASVPSNSVTPYAPSSGGGGGGGSSEPSTPTPTTPPVTEVPANEGADILVNGKTERAGTVKSTEVNGQSVLTVTVDPKKLAEKLASEGQHAVVTIPLAKDKKADVLVGELTGQMVKSMEQKQAVVKISFGDVTYTIPAEQINVSALSDQLGKPSALEDIKVRIEVAAPSKETLKVVENSAAAGNFTLVAPALNFTVKGTYGGATVEVSRFNAYVERTIAIPDGVDPGKITTGVVVEADGTVRHVPTRIVNVNGHYFAKINSLTNSTYSVIWHPIEFRDVAGHWAQNAVNDMGSRMVVSGVENGTFNPDTAITRAEFAAIMVRALGLKQEKASAPFSDVNASDWYSAAVQTAYAYKLIGGFEDGTFRPSDKITREQAMVIMAKAMKTTGLRDKLPSKEAAELLAPYADAAATAEWAKSGVADCLQGAIFAGRTATELAPKASITRAEVAAIVQRLLQKSELI
ncbi:S-layer homology domain-containing protein [Paenibacillus chitinolyticus]|uniref:S-layer homology domain-containing protein n=4 Tax=Paenibacillus chitinolyticus TaxID=79263 RepID=A0ABT4FDX1_9BACL|nr:S-layer homology domain-containing protein [Paenibacillus chitinolyticus]MCY9591144.1 S-layer homology domain-containing protein [Paenibacillus chitinolyticus]MCY9596715.1 S-layer homology domain-containing protein [Paenibacillus chitinolyticus]